MVISGANAVYIVGTFKHMGTDADFKVKMSRICFKIKLYWFVVG